MFRAAWGPLLCVMMALLVGTPAAIASPISPTAPTAASSKDKGEDNKFDVRELKKLIKQAILAQDHAGLREVLLRYARANDRDPVRAVLDQAAKLGRKDGAEDWYWALVHGAAAFNRPLACSEMGDFIIQYRNRPIAKDLLHALQKNKSKYVTRVVRRVLDRGTDDLKFLALDMAAQLQYRRTVDILMPFYKIVEEKADSSTAQQMRVRVILALEGLTKRKFGRSYVNWVGWWDANRHKGLKILREEAEDQDSTTGLARPIDPVREAQFIGLEKLPEGKVLVVEGPVARNGVNTNNDDIAQKLETLGIPHDTVLKERLEDKDYSIDRYAAILINCTQLHKFCQSPGHRGGNPVGNRLRRCLGPNPHDEVQFKMKRPALDKLEKWVERGGFLFTEDWVLTEAVAPVWPKLVAVGKVLEEDNVDIRPAKGQTTHPFLRGVFVPPLKLDDFDWDDDEDDWDEDEDEEKEKYDPTIEDDETDTEGGGSGSTGVGEDPEEQSEQFEDPVIDLVKHEWKIDNESNAIDVRSKKVATLITSRDLRAKGASPAVAITFGHGRGKVLHVLSHFGKQSSSENEATIENLLINFLIEVKIRVVGP